MTATSNGEHQILLRPARCLQFKRTGNTDRDLHRFLLTQQKPFLGAHRQTSRFFSTDGFSVLQRSRADRRAGLPA